MNRHVACLLLAVVVLSGWAPAQTSVVEGAKPEPPPVQWYDLSLVARGLAVLIPSDWEYKPESGWHSGDDLRLVLGWTDGAAGGPLGMAESMKLHVESGNATSAVEIEALPVDEGDPRVVDLTGVHTDAAGKQHWQWTRILERPDASIVLLSAQGDFSDTERIAQVREQLALTYSSLLNAARPEGDESGFMARTSDDLLDLGQLGAWAVLEQLWGHPQIQADLVLSVGLVKGETSEERLAERLLADARAATQREMSVEAGEGSGGLAYRVVGNEPDEGDEPLAARLNERVRWAQCSFSPGSDGLWVLKAEVDLRVTHADDFLANAITGLEPIFDVWSVTPLDPPSPAR